MHDIEGFLRTAGWSNAVRTRMTGDASRRRYERISRGTEHAVLMICPPGDDSLDRFADMTTRLHAAGLSAPDILAQDTPAGMMLLEDFGDDLYATVTTRAPALRSDLLSAAADIIARVNTLDPTGLPVATPQTLLRALDPTRDWVPGLDPTAFEHLREALRPHIETVCGQANAVSLRDYHAGNLLWLPDRVGLARVGLLDYQDAFLIHPAYDLVSLLEDVRQSHPDDVKAAVTERFIAATGADPDRFAHAFATLTVQRNLRILGVFFRLARRDGKTAYLDHLDATWLSIRRALDHPDLGEVRNAFLAAIPRVALTDTCLTDPALP